MTAAAPEDYTARAAAALTEAARDAGHDFAGWLAHVLAKVAGELGGTDALTFERPGSWEAAAVDGLVKGTVGWDDEYLALPEWRTRAPQFGHTAHGVDVGERDYRIVAAGHVDPRRFLAAANHFARHAYAGDRLIDSYAGARQPEVWYLHARHGRLSTEQAWSLDYDTVPGGPGSFPVTVLEF